VPASTWSGKWKSTFLATAQMPWPATFRQRLKLLALALTACQAEGTLFSPCFGKRLRS